MTSQRSAVIAAAIGVTVFTLAYMLPSTVGKAFEMDEGAVNAYATEVLDGAVPHRDFLTFYGPGNPWLVAGAFTVLGESVGVERTVGVLYRVLIVLALFLVGRRLGGTGAGVAAALVAATIMAEDVIWAYATYGALAFALLGLAVLSWAATWESPSRGADVALVGAGLASGCALLVRFDFVPAVVLSALPILALASRRARIHFGAGVLAGIAVLVVHLAVVGPERIGRVVDDLRATGSGRYLQRQTVWEFPGNLLLAANVATCVVIVAGAFLAWRRRAELGPRVALAVGLFSACLLPLTISRMDPLHIRPYAVVPLSALPGVALLVLAEVRVRWVRAVGAIAVLAAVAFGVVHYGRYDADRFRTVRDVKSGYRGFYDDDSAGARIIVERARRVTRPGESLFVGPQDLRRTNYGPTYMYFLLRQLEPASYYMEMNPSTANREDSGLADELEQADWLILTSEWDTWDEANDSVEYGSPEPNRVVDELFCERFESGQYRLYERCDRPGGGT